MAQAVKINFINMYTFNLYWINPRPFCKPATGSGFMPHTFFGCSVSKNPPLRIVQKSTLHRAGGGPNPGSSGIPARQARA